MAQLQRRAIGSPVAPAVAPLLERNDHRPEIAALGGEPVGMARRPFLVGLAAQQTGLDEFFQAHAEQVRRHAGLCSHFVEAPRAQEQLADDHQRPGVTHHIERAGYGAGHVGEYGFTHGWILTSFLKL